jgi:hypothetical protein
MIKWEYKTEHQKFRNYIDLEKKLNEYGNDSWELIFFEIEKSDKFTTEKSYSTIFKRPIIK